MLKPITILSHLPLRLVAADVADLQAEGLMLRGDAAIPEGLGFGAVLDDIAQLVDLDLGIGMPGTGGRRAIQAEIFDQLQALVADVDGLIGLLGSVLGCREIEILDLLHHPIAEEMVDHHGIPAEQRVRGRLNVIFHFVPEDHVVQQWLQVTQVDLHKGAVILIDKPLDCLFIRYVDIIHDHLFDPGGQIGDRLMGRLIITSSSSLEELSIRFGT